MKTKYFIVALALAFASVAFAQFSWTETDFNESGVVLSKCVVSSGTLMLKAASDSFSVSTLDTDRWTTPAVNEGVTYAIESNMLTVTVPGINTSGYKAFDVQNKRTLVGDFDYRVWFNDANFVGGDDRCGVNFLISVPSGASTNYFEINHHARISSADAGKNIEVEINAATMATVSVTGTSYILRITRAGSTVTAYYWNGSSWVSLYSSSNSYWDDGDATTILNVYANPGYSHGSGSRKIYFDNYTRVSGSHYLTPGYFESATNDWGSDTLAFGNFTSTQTGSPTYRIETKATDAGWNLAGATAKTPGTDITGGTVSDHQRYMRARVELTSASPYTSSPTVSDFTITATSPPWITTDPVSQTICVGENITFPITAKGGGLTYQWQEYIASWADLSDGGVYSGTTTNTLAITGAPLLMSGRQYRCIVSGTYPPADTSNSATLTVGSMPGWVETAFNEAGVTLNKCAVSGGTLMLKNADDDFSSTTIDTDRWRASTWGTGTYGIESSKLKATINSGSGVDFRNRRSVIGDFRYQVTFNAAQLPGKGARARAFIALVTESGHWFEVMFHGYADGSKEITVEVDGVDHAISTSATTLTFLLLRRSTTIVEGYWSTDGGSSWNYRWGENNSIWAGANDTILVSTSADAGFTGSANVYFDDYLRNSSSGSYYLTPGYFESATNDWGSSGADFNTLTATEAIGTGTRTYRIETKETDTGWNLASASVKTVGSDITGGTVTDYQRYMRARVQLTSASPYTSTPTISDFTINADCPCPVFDPLGHYFLVQDSVGNNLMKVDENGNVGILGTVFINTVETPDGSRFEMKTAGGITQGWVDVVGNLYIKGSLYQNSTTFAPDTNDFVIQNFSGTNVFMLDGTTGNLYCRGFIGQGCGF